MFTEFLGKDCEWLRLGEVPASDDYLERKGTEIPVFCLSNWLDYNSQLFISTLIQVSCEAINILQM